MLKNRVITALWGLPLVILAVWFDWPLPWLTLLVALWGVLAAIEFYRMTGVWKTLALTVFGLVWTLLFILQPHLDYAQSIPMLLTSCVIISLIILIFLRDREGVFQRWAWMLAGIFYIGWLLGFFVALRLEGGRGWVFLALFATFASDTAAYFIGKAFGRHKLAPSISPGKTLEGAIAGVCGAAVASLLITFIPSLQIGLGYGQAIALGLLISVFGQTGDLAESLLKRSTGVKDSGNLLPGHGGILDRTDSLLFAGAVAYYFFLLVK